ncbi:hypothetical protein ACPCSE_29215 [Streptomyces cellulosae]
MKKTDLRVGTMYAYSEGPTRVPTPARLLDLRLWRNNTRISKRDPAAWCDMSDDPRARPGRSGSYTNSAVTGYLILCGVNWQSKVTAEEVAAVEVPPLPEDSKEAAKVIAGLDLPKGITVDLVPTAHLRQPWEEYAKEKAAQDAKEAEERRAREELKQRYDTEWADASARLDTLAISATRSRMDRDWETREPKVLLPLSELVKLLDMAEGKGWL